MCYNYFFIVFQVEFLTEGRVVKVAADNVVQALGGAVQPDILIGGAGVHRRVFFVTADKSQMQRRVFYESLRIQNAADIFFAYIFNGVFFRIVKPNAVSLQNIYFQVLFVLRSRDAVLAVMSEPPGCPEDFAQGLDIYRAGGKFTRGFAGGDGIQ